MSQKVPTTAGRDIRQRPHQHGEQQRLDLWVGQHLLVQQHVGLGHGNLAKVRVPDSLRLCNQNMEEREDLLTVRRGDGGRRASAAPSPIS